MEIRHLEKIYDKTEWDKIRNETISATLKEEPLRSKITKRQLNWYGHTS